MKLLIYTEHTATEKNVCLHSTDRDVYKTLHSFITLFNGIPVGALEIAGKLLMQHITVHQ
jgi:hypothetical protein